MSRDTTTATITSQDASQRSSLRLVGPDGFPDFPKRSSSLYGPGDLLTSPSPSNHSSPASYNFSQPTPRQGHWQGQWQGQGKTQARSHVQVQDVWGPTYFTRTSLYTVADEDSVLVPEPEPEPEPTPAPEHSKSPRFYASLPPSMTVSTSSIPTIDTEPNHNKRHSRSSTSLYTLGGTSRNASRTRHSLYHPKPSSPVKSEVVLSDDDKKHNNDGNSNSNSIINRRPMRKLTRRSQHSLGHVDTLKSTTSQNKSFIRSLGKLFGVSQRSK